MKAIDKSVPAYYAAGREYHRLRENIGLIEFERTKEIILEILPKPPAVIYDIGGAWLAREIVELWKNEASQNALMNTIRLLDTNEEIIGLSCHLLAVSGN